MPFDMNRSANRVGSVAFLLPALLAVTVMSCVGGPDSHTNFPRYSVSRTEEQRCKSWEPAFLPVDYEEQHDSLFSYLISPERRPKDDERIFYVILVGESGFLTVGGEDQSMCLLFFTSPLRASYYGCEVLGYDKPLRCKVFSASEIAGGMSTAPGESDVPLVTFDKCVHCNVQAVLPWSDLKSADDVLTAWAVFSATTMLMRQGLLRRARLLFQQGDLEQAKTICLDIIECTDIDYPEVHLLLGKCAVRLGDDRLKQEAYEFLTLFEPNWTDSLTAFESESRL